MNTNSIANYVSMQNDNNDLPYCCYLDNNNNYTILSSLQTTPASVFSYANNSNSGLKFVFDTLNKLVPYTVAYTGYEDYKYYFYKWTGPSLTKQLVASPLFFNFNTSTNFFMTPRHTQIINVTTVDLDFSSWTTLKADQSATTWQMLGKDEAGLIATKTNQSTIKFDKNGIMYLCYTDNINLGAVSVLKYQNNSFSLVGNQYINNANAGFWQFELDNNGSPTLVYANNQDTSDVIIKKFDGVNWVRLGTTNFHSNWYDKRPYVFYDKFNNTYIYNYNGIKYENTIHKLVDNEWQLITGNDWRFSESDLYGTPFLIDTNNTINSVFGAPKGNGWCNAVQRFNTVFTPDLGTCTQNFLSDFAIDKTTNSPCVSWTENSTNGKSHVQKFINGKWVTFGDSLDFPVADYNKNSSHLILDSLGNPYYLVSSYADSSRLSLFYLKNSRWKRLGNKRISNFQCSNYNAAINNNKFYVIYTNKGAWIRTIDLPALASINSLIDSCNGNSATLNVNISNALNYQWQNNKGEGFVNISDNSVYKGTNSKQLTINTNLSNLSQQQLRCLVTKSSGAQDTTNFISFSCHYADSIKALPTLLLFPNPTSSVFTVDAKKNIYHYEMTDVLGKILISQSPGPIARINGDLSSFPAGVYYLNIYYGNNENRVFKILKE